MKHATIAKFRNHLSRYLREVQRGETIEILDREVPVARLVAIPPPKPGGPKEDEEAWLTRLERKGIIKRGDGKAVPEILQGFPPGTPPLGAVDALLEERRKGR
jgi:prevent-host-death family protein